MYSSQKLLSRLFAIVIFTCLPVAAQRVIATVPVGQGPWGMALNPVTHQLYVANPQCGSCQNGPTVTVIDEDTFATTTVPIGYSYLNETPIAVNTATNKIYVVNACGNDLYCGSNGTLTIIDGATLATTTVQLGTKPEALAINELTNKIFVVNACGYDDCFIQTLTIIDGATLAQTTIGTGLGYYYTPPAVAVNTVTNKVFVVNPCTDQSCFGDGNVMVIDPVTLSNTYVTVGKFPGIVAVNNTTNKIYVANGEASVTVIDGTTLSTSTVLVQGLPVRLAVNQATNQIYVVCTDQIDGYGQLAAIDGGTLATYFYPLPQYPTGLGINGTTNKIYISSEVNPDDVNGFLTVFDGSNLSMVNVTVGPMPIDLVVNATNNRIYTENQCASLSYCGLDVPGSVSVVDGTPPAAWQFIPVNPCRVVDTRNPDGTFGGPPIQGGNYRDFPISQGGCEIPSAATAYALNVTVVPHGPLGYLTIWPSGQPQPVISTMNSPDGRVKANAAIMAAGSNGAVSVYASDTTDVALDISGYFVALPDPNALAFYPLTPCRVADTRNPNGPLGGPFLQAGQGRDFPVLDATECNIPNTAKAYSLNFTVVPQQTLNYLTVWPTGQPQPTVSTLNDGTGTIIANAAIIPAGANGDINAYATDNTELIIDINGYFAPPGTNGLSLYAPPPCRIVDTRGQYPGAFSGAYPFGVVSTGCSAPTLAQAFVLNATVAPRSPLGYLTLWPDSEQQPLVSTLNAVDGAITSNMAIVPNVDGSVDAFASNTTYLILDISGYFAP
jgi:DNA-binding beta-propeller fold protein YncE